MISILAEKAINLAWELRLGIRTRGLAGVGEADTEHIHYGTIPYRAIAHILDHLRLTADDVFVDLGSGKGRVICCAARRPIHEAIGIECSAPLSDIARTNSAALRGSHAPITCLKLEAQQYEFSVGTVLYLFHPFGPETLRKVVQRLREGLDRNPRHIRIVYVNPVHEHVLREYSWLTEYDRWEQEKNFPVGHTVSWWTSVRTPSRSSGSGESHSS